MGNSAAGLWCVASGLPVYKLVLATNANDAVVRAVRDAMLERQPMAHTVSEAMNTQLPYNFERLLHLAANGDCSRVRAWMAAVDRNEPLQLEEDVLFWLRERLLVGAADNEKTLKCIRSTWAEYAYAIDPHTAVGLEVLAVMRQPGGSLAEDGGPPLAPVCLATAHPCKFEEAATAALGEEWWAREMLGGESDSERVTSARMPARARRLAAMAEETCAPLRQGEDWTERLRAVIESAGLPS